MNTGGVEEDLIGIPTKEPAFGLPALWISPDLRDKAEAMGYTVVDAPSVLATHLSEVIRRNGADLLTRQEVQKLTDMVKETAPAVVEELRIWTVWKPAAQVLAWPAPEVNAPPRKWN